MTSQVILAEGSIELFTRISIIATVNSVLPPKKRGTLSSNQKYSPNRIYACSSRETISRVFRLKIMRIRLFLLLFKSCLPFCFISLRSIDSLLLLVFLHYNPFA